MLRWLFSLIIFAALSVSAQARQSVPLDTGKVVAQLVSSHDTVPAGGTFYLALRTELDDHWHTYWRNPGDSGEPVQIDWVAPDGVTFGDIIWPLPRPIATGPIFNYGFEGAPLFPVKVAVPPSAKSGDILNITADFYYLVCKDVCIPEEGKASLPIMVGEVALDDRWNSAIETAIAASPKKAGLSGGIQKISDRLVIELNNLPEGDFSEAYFFPIQQGVLGHSQPQAVTMGSQGVRLETTPEFLWNSATPKTFDGVITYMDGGEYRGQAVALAVGQSVNIGEVAKIRQPISIAAVLLAMVGAFAGGLVLNLMPCVFPIISLKALSLSKAAHSQRSAAKREAWLYVAGVLATFVVLVGILLALKAAGASLGWGFQLQSPKVTGFLALLMFIIGLNLLGVFEIGSRLQGSGQSLTERSGAAGSFFTGALAVIVATPCTAPFMAGAMGYALAQPALITMLVFLALGFGFAAPFLLLGYLPKLLTKLPKPGPWMETFRQFLAFPMFAAAIWLAWVMGNQAGSDGLSLLLISALLVGFGIWLLRRSGVARILGIAALVAAIALPLKLSTAPKSSVETAYQAWSPAAVQEALTDGRPVFVDFTADWCVTCKVNERLVLKTDKVRKLFEETDTAFMVADWTNKNDQIAQELASYERAGVPLYLVFRPDSQNSVRGAVLPQILTFDVIEEAIKGTN